MTEERKILSGTIIRLDQNGELCWKKKNTTPSAVDKAFNEQLTKKLRECRDVSNNLKIMLQKTNLENLPTLRSGIVRSLVKLYTEVENEQAQGEQAELQAHTTACSEVAKTLLENDSPCEFVLLGGVTPALQHKEYSIWKGIKKPDEVKEIINKFKTLDRFLAKVKEGQVSVSFFPSQENKTAYFLLSRGEKTDSIKAPNLENAILNLKTFTRNSEKQEKPKEKPKRKQKTTPAPKTGNPTPKKATQDAPTQATPSPTPPEIQPTPIRSIQAAHHPDAEPIVLVLDTNILHPLAARMKKDDPNSTHLGLLTKLTEIANITIIIPATIANAEARGLQEIWDKERMQEQPFASNYNRTTTTSEKLVDRGNDLTTFFKPAYRLRQTSDGGWEHWVPKDGANPRLIILETPTCSHGRKGTFSHQEKQNLGEKTIVQMLESAMPFPAHAVIVTEDTQYEWPQCHRIKFLGMLEALKNVDPDSIDNNLHDLTKAIETEIRIDNRRRSSEEPCLYRQGECLPTSSSDTFADLLQRNVAAHTAGSKLAPLEVFLDPECAKKGNRLSAYGLFIEALMNGTVTYEALANKINDLNKAESSGIPLINADILHRYTSGQEWPDQDTHYALMSALVWQSVNYSEQEKKILTQRLMDTWKTRESANFFTTKEEQEAYHGYGNVLAEIIGADQQTALTTLNKPKEPNVLSTEPVTSAVLSASIRGQNAKDPRDVLKTLKAIDQLRIDAGGAAMSDDEKRVIFNVMIQGLPDKGR